MRMTRQWQNLHLLLRAGRAHAEGPDRIGDTKPGECALLCPACPQPEKNLPPNWKDAPAEKAYVTRRASTLETNSHYLSFLYAVFLAIDANFRLKRKDVSSEEKDPGLSNGWTFFGEVNAPRQALGSETGGTLW
jgi:hypothetical protein